MMLREKLADALRGSARWYDAVFIGPYRRTAQRTLAREEDLFMWLCFSEWLGIPVPAPLFSLELYPYLIPRFHEWHRRMGLEHSPLDEIKCC